MISSIFVGDAYPAMADRAGNLLPLPGVFLDQMAFVLRDTVQGRELTMLRWEFPRRPVHPASDQ